MLHPLFTHSQRSLHRLAIVLTTVVAVGLGAAVTAKGDQVVLTSGAVSIDCSAPFPIGGAGGADLTGQNFLVHLSFAGPTVCSPAPVNLGLTTLALPFDANGFVIFQGVGTSVMVGSLSFDETSITGFVEGRGPDLSGVLFRVDFTGSGIGTITSQRSTFEVVAVPEPATLILMGTGLAGVVGAARRARKVRKIGNSL